MSTIPQPLQALITRFAEHIDEYQRSEYNETQLRRDYLDHFIKILGWDVDNQSGYAENFREVVHEDRIKIEGQMKAPDYGIQMASVRLFYLEAKKPSVNLKDDPKPAIQVRRYGWTAKMPVCLLSDFHEFAVYDTSIRPKSSDDAAVARIFYCRYDELDKPSRFIKKTTEDTEGTENVVYLSNWEYLESIFSKEAVMHGSLEKLKSSNKRKGTQEVDEAFLQEIEAWRDNLARNITLRNEAITERGLNFVVQKTIDRIIFLRICEDRGIEQPDILKSIAAGKEVYKNLLNYFMKADDRYNSGLFHFHTEKNNRENPDTLSETIAIDDKVLKDIISSLYYPAPYEFAVFPADILGSVYERFLGKVIRLTTGHHAKVEQKPEVRKAGGVFYTPNYIAKYIIDHTLKPLLEKKTVQTAAEIRILDPSCGSGSFLIEAYQYLLDWYLKEYITAKDAKNAKKKYSQIVQVSKDEFKLTIPERKRILTTHIFGVDIDTQAVEVTQMSLLLKMAEGINEQEIQKSLFNERLLPDLSHNIKCGNSLISSDFYAQGILGISEEEQYKVNVFDWQIEFTHIMQNGGFTVILGNPPYGAFYNSLEQDYFKKHYKISNYQYDSYFFFVERSLSLLTKNGYLGYIIPNTWLLNLTASALRKYIFSNIKIESISHYQNKVFKEAVVDTEVVIFRNTNDFKNNINIEIKDRTKTIFMQKLPQSRLVSLNGAPFNIMERDEYKALKDKMQKFPKLDMLCKITQGTKPFQVGKGKPAQTKTTLKDKPYVSTKQIDKTFRPLLRGSMMNRYMTKWENDYWIKFGDWLAEPRYSASYDLSKIIIRQTGDSLIATYDENKFIVRDNLYTIVNNSGVDIQLKYVLGLLNSHLLNWYYQNILNPEKGEALAQVKRGHLAVLPIPSVPSESSVVKNIVSLVDQMLALKQKEGAESLPQSKEILSRQISALDKSIDKAVYEVYGLSEDEIAIVEGK